MRREFGPWAVRFLAAEAFARDNVSMSSTWDRASQFLALKPPTLFDGYFGAGRSERPAAPAPSPLNDSQGVFKPTTQLPAAAPPTPDELLNCRRRPSTQLRYPETLTNPSPSPARPSASQPRGGHRGDESPKKAQAEPTSKGRKHSFAALRGNNRIARVEQYCRSSATSSPRRYTRGLKAVSCLVF